ncbi:hypothetical protein D3C72_2346120 [compost metagenome]
MRAADLVGAGEIGEGARHLQHTVVGAGREVEALGGLQQQGLALPVGIDQLLNQRRAGGGIGEDVRVPGLGIAPALAFAGRFDTLGDVG